LAINRRVDPSPSGSIASINRTTSDSLSTVGTRLGRLLRSPANRPRWSAGNSSAKTRLYKNTIALQA
jgi:hypothetical protein